MIKVSQTNTPVCARKAISASGVKVTLNEFLKYFNYSSNLKFFIRNHLSKTVNYES